MVKSSLNSSINYPEEKKIDSEDIEFDAQPWEINLLGEDILIALGKEKYSHIKKNIVYFPIYLIKKDKVDSQIGIYETRADKLPALLDEDGDIDIEGFDKPLLYNFVNKALLYSESNDKEIESDDDDPDEPNDSSEEASIHDTPFTFEQLLAFISAGDSESLPQDDPFTQRGGEPFESPPEPKTLESLRRRLQKSPFARRNP